MPDCQTEYFLECAVECVHISADVYAYAMRHEPDADAVLAQPVGDLPEGTPHWRTLALHGRAFEDAMVAWRARGNRDEAVAAATLGHLPHALGDLAKTWGSSLAEKGIGTIGSAATDVLAEKWCSDITVPMLRRSLERAADDFAGWGRDRFQALADRPRGLSLHRRIPAGTPVTRASRKRLSTTRKAIRRSADFLRRVAGAETVRMFLGEGIIRVEGRHAIYEIRNVRDLDHSYSGFEGLSVIDKADGTILCRMCILTRGVPMMDHVASLILHIRSGLEADVLSAGNATNIHPRAREMDWLAPYLPALRPAPPVGIAWAGTRRGGFVIPDPFPFQTQNPEECGRMAKLVGGWLVNEVVGPFLPMVRAAAPMVIGARADGLMLPGLVEA